jgi:hypothetical protein
MIQKSGGIEISCYFSIFNLRKSDEPLSFHENGKKMVAIG